MDDIIKKTIQRIRFMASNEPGPYDLHEDALKCAIILADELERRDKQPEKDTGWIPIYGGPK